jgi:hypothetical protein
MPNILGHETSPYLLQHKDNPVHWQPWGTEAFETARRDGRPVLLSIGYAACHWCHVMAHESFENAEIAARMNELFVNIKVDREERPDIDTIYQHALALLGQQGGWPLTMFLTPNGEPFWGGTYFPPESRYGRPGFPEVLHQIHRSHRDEPDKVANNTTALVDALAKLGQPPAGASAGALSPRILDQLAEHVVGQIDTVHGGMRGAPKFPNCSILEFLWRAWFRTGRDVYRDAVLVSLDRMCQGGIYDHLGGGFARYSTDPRWLAPHFEKMLYDNAQLIDILVAAWRETQSPLYRARMRETIDWIRREMRAEGGFAATQDADSEGEEGRFYVWSEADIDRLLGDRASAFKAAYDVSAAGNWEGRNILNRSARPALGAAKYEEMLAECRAILFRERDTRPKPAWDDKVLADWNGLLIASLANAAGVFDEPDWLALAAGAFDFVCEEMAAGGRLLHSYRAGQAKITAMIDDYAAMARAALALHEATGAPCYIDRARDWVAICDEYYWDATHGGYFFTASDAEGLIVRTRSAADNATPAGNGVMVGVLARLYHLTGDDVYRARGEELIDAFTAELERGSLAMTTLMNNFELLESAVRIVIVGAREAADTEALARIARAAAAPNRLLMIVAPGADTPASHPAHGKTAIDGQATAYVCIGQTCSLPLWAPAALRAALPRPPPAG